jgi:hypothetical protein
MSNVVKWTGITRLPIAPDDVLQGAAGKLDYVLVLGVEKDGRMYTASSDGNLSEALWFATRFIHKLHAGDYS